MSKIITGIFIGVMIVGGLFAWNLIPMSWVDRIPPMGQIAIVTCVIIFSLIMLIGYVIDSGIPQKIFKKK
jgi:hypothetical protein